VFIFATGFLPYKTRYTLHVAKVQRVLECSNMVRKPLTIQHETIPGASSLKEAQRAALSATAEDLAATIRRLLQSGRLVSVDGKIIPARR